MAKRIREERDASAIRLTRYCSSLLILILMLFRQAVEYFQQAVAFDDKDGHTWEELAYCYLMINDLQNSYTAYQHALYHIQNPKVRGLVAREIGMAMDGHEMRVVGISGSQSCS